MSTQTALLAEIERYVAKIGIAESTFGFRAVNDGKFVTRLRAKANMTLDTIEKAKAYIAENPAPKKAA